MSAADTSGFGKFIPGFDFLQNLSKGAGNLPQMPNLANWVAPTLNVEELDKRISELKNVHFWLEQNTRALSATIQALEVQKMTLATLKGMNFNIADVANALKPRPAAEPTQAPGVARHAAQQQEAAARAEPPKATAQEADEAATAAGAAAKPGMQGLVDPLQLWGSLTHQFQQIAASAVKEVAASHAASQAAASQAVQQAASHVAKEVAKQAARQTTPKAAVSAAKSKAATPQPAAAKGAAKRATGAKTAARKTVGK